MNPLIVQTGRRQNRATDLWCSKAETHSSMDSCFRCSVYYLLVEAFVSQ